MLQDLPELVLDLISDHLSYEDMLVLRSTCKSLKAFVDHKKFTKLNLFVRKFWYPRQLFYTDKPVGYPHALHLNHLTTTQDSSKFKEQFASVQQMIIDNYSTEFDEFDLNLLNYYRSLSHVELNGFAHIKGNLNLEVLRIAAFRVKLSGNSDSSFELTCPQLRALKIVKCKAILSSETNQLEYLHLGNFLDAAEYLGSISLNLRRLSTICLKMVYQLLDLLSGLKEGSLSMPLLTKIALEQQNDDIEDLDELASCLEDPKIRQIKHVQLTFNGRAISSPKLRRIASLIRAYEPAANDYSDKFDICSLMDPYFRYISGNPELDFLLSSVWSLELREDTKLSEETIKKLKGIEMLMFQDRFKASYSILEAFAKNCKSLYLLYLGNQVVTQRLLEMLSKHLVNSLSLSIYQCKYETVRPVVKFRNLISFDLDFILPKDEMTFIFENCQTLQKIRLNAVELLRISTQLYRIKLKGSQIAEFDNLQAMLDYCLQKELLRERKDGEASTRLNSTDHY